MKLSWLLGGNLFYALSQWLVLVIFTKHFSASEVGEYFFALALSAPIFILISCRLNNLIITNSNLFLHKGEVYTFKFLSNILSVIFILLAYIFFQKNSTFFIIISIIIYKILEQYDDLLIAYKQIDLDFKAIFLIKFVRSCVFLFLIFFNSFNFNSLGEAILSATIMYVLFWILKNRKEGILPSWDFDFNRIINIFKCGIYLSSSSFLSALITSGTRIYIGYALGSAILAIYGVLSYSLIALNILVSALGQYFLPYFVKYKNNYKELFLQVFRSQLILSALIIPSLIFIFFFGETILSILYGATYAEYNYHLLIIFIAGWIKCSSALFGTFITAMKIYKFQLKLNIFLSIFIIIILPLFVINYGFLGAIYTLLILNIIELIIYILVSLKLKFEHAKDF